MTILEQISSEPSLPAIVQPHPSFSAVSAIAL